MGGKFSWERGFVEGTIEMVALAEKCIFLNIRVLPVYPDANWKRHFEVISSLRALITTMGCDTYC